MTPKPVDLETLSALEAKATPGEWEFLENRAIVAATVSDASIASSVFDTQFVPDMSLIVALRNAAPAMIQELKEARAEREGLNATLLAREDAQIADRKFARDAIATLKAERDALRAELLSVRDRLDEFNQNDRRESDCVGGAVRSLLALRAEVERLKAQSRDEHSAASDVRIALEREIDSIRAQLATAHDDALEEAALELGIYRPSAEQNGDPEVLRSIAHTVAYPDAAARVRALKKTTKGGGA